MLSRSVITLQRDALRQYYSHYVTQQKFKETMSRISNQVMILTTSSMKGVTLGSATSLALQPRPMIQFNLQLPSFTSQELHKRRKFALHLMAPTEQSVKLARLFSKGAIRRPDSGVMPTRPFEALAAGADFALHKTSASTGGSLEPVVEDEILDHGLDKPALGARTVELPVLASAERVLICECIRCFRVGDHEIWVGMVEEILSPANNAPNSAVTGGLMYCNRQFFKIGSPIE
ncbi:AAR087Cp [Eremothecium gossypii ATCC 10895]|uniref:AAR087Cp n=1 Tax=Eremothecium gossypii (strain ATCC 10895 / CBS 109.51 / FGSC 9923 / NRRL Y-1056) TaxID=284811 RepID=Q75EJ2_EREGS|nr:AAR087Cp [Eremothecium gossypii ATCC 10895]AAS50452.1 AAR087Cp [Eremothecium gossypii ATCC 10895]